MRPLPLVSVLVQGPMQHKDAVSFLDCELVSERHILIEFDR